jgi:hypothetical protein
LHADDKAKLHVTRFELQAAERRQYSQFKAFRLTYHVGRNNAKPTTEASVLPRTFQSSMNGHTPVRFLSTLVWILAKGTFPVFSHTKAKSLSSQHANCLAAHRQTI